MNKLLGYLKQLLPLKYRATYMCYKRGRKRGRRIYCTWRMWFGRCFSICDIPMPKACGGNLQDLP